MKQNYTVLTNIKCSRCSKPLKANLVEKKENATLCYKCDRISRGKPPYHVPREKRIKAGLPVHRKTL